MIFGSLKERDSFVHELVDTYGRAGSSATDLEELTFYVEASCRDTVVRLDLNLWLVVREPNVVAIELLGVHAGALPISIQSMLEELADSAQQANIEVTWYRHEGHPVALLHFQADREHPRYLLQRLELQDGRLVLAGKSSGDAVPFRQMVSMLEQGH